MTASGRPSSGLSSGLLIGLLLVLVVGGVIAFLMFRTPAAEAPTSNQSNTTNTNTTEEPLDIGLTWPRFTSPYRISVPLPRGMNPCDEKNGVFSIRTDDCTATTNPSLRFRRNEAWDSLSAVAAFNDAFAQELREAGIESVEGKSFALAGKNVSVMAYRFSDELSGVMMTELNPGEGKTARRVSLLVYRKVPATVDGVAQDIDAVVAAVVKEARFSQTPVLTQPTE